MTEKRKKLYVNKRDNETYELSITTKLDSDGLPVALYQLRNEIHSWEGDQKAFENEFQRL